MRNIKTVIIALGILIALLILGNRNYMTNAQSVSELHPVLSYEDATTIANNLREN